MAIDFSKYGQSVGTTATTTKSVDFSKYGEAVSPTKNKVEEPKKQGYLSRVMGQYTKAGQEIQQGVEQGANALTSNSSVPNKQNALTRVGLRTVGAVANAAFAPIVEAPVVKQALEFTAQQVVKVPYAKDVIKAATELASKHPNEAKDLKNIIDIASLGVGGAVEKPLVKEATAVGSDILKGTKSVLTPSEEAVQKNVLSLFQKAIKPTAQKTLAKADQYDNSVLSALKTIKNNSNDLNIVDSSGEIITGRTPQSINELAQSIEQTKGSVFKQYDDLAKQADAIGVAIDAKPIAQEVLKVADSKALQLTSPEVVKYAENWAERLDKMETLDAETTQEVIKMMNNNLNSFYKNPTYDAASRVAVDAGIANNFRVALDKAIEGATGSEYQALKKQYGALKAIENDVVRASMRDARKNTKGLLDYTDLFTGGQMVSGILSMNPAMFTKGAVERGFKEYIKAVNDPNRAISNIFNKLDKETGQPFIPNSVLFKAAQSTNVAAQKAYPEGIPVGLSIKPTITPTKVAKNIDAEDVANIRKFLNDPLTATSDTGVSNMLKGIGIEKAGSDVQQRFLKDVLIEADQTPKLKEMLDSTKNANASSQ